MTGGPVQVALLDEHGGQPHVQVSECGQRSAPVSALPCRGHARRADAPRRVDHAQATCPRARQSLRVRQRCRRRQPGSATPARTGRSLARGPPARTRSAQGIPAHPLAPCGPRAWSRPVPAGHASAPPRCHLGPGRPTPGRWRWWPGGSAAPRGWRPRHRARGGGLATRAASASPSQDSTPSQVAREGGRSTSIGTTTARCDE